MKRAVFRGSAFRELQDRGLSLFFHLDLQSGAEDEAAKAGGKVTDKTTKPGWSWPGFSISRINVIMRLCRHTQLHYKVKYYYKGNE
jgi:hypothetical protein